MKLEIDLTPIMDQMSEIQKSLDDLFLAVRDPGKLSVETVGQTGKKKGTGRRGSGKKSAASTKDKANAAPQANPFETPAQPTMDLPEVIRKLGDLAQEFNGDYGPSQTVLSGPKYNLDNISKLDPTLFQQFLDDCRAAYDATQA